jgi:hypothetical protein
MTLEQLKAYSHRCAAKMKSVITLKLVKNLL